MLAPFLRRSSTVTSYGLSGERKERLLAVACCRLALASYPDQRLEGVLRMAEEYADGRATAAELREARPEADRVHIDLVLKAYEREPGSFEMQMRVASAVSIAAEEAGFADESVSRVVSALSDSPFRPYKEYARREANAKSRVAHLLRCIFGNPFHRPAIDPAVLKWHDGTVGRMAQGIYGDHAFARLSILADALLDAGCDDGALIAHCRSNGPHVRGCWAVDLILGKE